MAPTPAESPETAPDPTAADAEQARAALVRYSQKMVADRLVVGSAGNISVAWATGS